MAFWESHRLIFRRGSSTGERPASSFGDGCGRLPRRCTRGMERDGSAFAPHPGRACAGAGQPRVACTAQARSAAVRDCPCSSVSGCVTGVRGAAAGAGLVAVDLATGALFVNAALAYVMVALVMAGWAPDAAYALIGGWRFLGQLIAYSMLIVMPLTAVAMRAQSLATTEIVASQAVLWNVVAQPLGFALFWLAAMALAFVPPFDLPVAPGELAGGVFAEYTGVRLAIVRLGRLLLVLTLALAVVVFFLGGWLGALLPAWGWTSVKTLGVAAAMLAIGRYVPRLSPDTVLAWAWKLGIPLALVNILWVGITLLMVPR